MPSSAAQAHEILAGNACQLKSIASNKRLRPLTRAICQTYYQAALAAHVAAWESYIEALITDYYSITSNPALPAYHAIHAVAKRQAEDKLKKFNTPNFDNSRQLMVETTGYDPYADWIWPARSMGVIDVQQRINEILKARHSFAHGNALPAYKWNISTSGRCRLTSKTLDMINAFFRNLVKRTDAGMKNHLQTSHRIQANW